MYGIVLVMLRRPALSRMYYITEVGYSCGYSRLESVIGAEIPSPAVTLADNLHQPQHMLLS